MEEKFRSLVCVGMAHQPPFQGVFFFSFFQTLTNKKKEVYHMLSANGSLSSQFRRTVSFSQWKWFHSFRKHLSSPLSSSFHPCSAYLLSSNPVLFCRWRTGAIIGSLRLTLDQNVRQFKAACQSAFCTNSSPELPRDKGRKKCSTYLWITRPLLLLFRVYVRAQYMNVYSFLEDDLY